MSTKLKEFMETPTASINITPTTSIQQIDVVEKATANVAAMPVGVLGNVTASKSISGNTATVTPSISNGTAGYNAMTGKSGTAVTVQASELVNGDITITTNTTTDVTNYKNVITNVINPIPVEISTEAEMDSLLVEANEGKVYKFTGTTGTYTNGDLYVPEPKSWPSIYHIYESDGTTEIPITNWTISGLANAYYYTKNGGALQRVGGRIYCVNGCAVEGTDDKFYVYDTTNGLQSNLKWSTDTSTEIGCTANILGSGKSNSAIMNTAMGNTSGTIWYFIKNTMNARSIGSCNDWYIGSTVEIDLLRSSGLVNWFNSNQIWSSVEYLNWPSRYACRWSSYQGCWLGNTKDDAYKCFAVRSF